MSTTTDHHLDAVSHAALLLADTEEEVETRKQIRDQAIIAAVEAGVSLAAAGRAAGITYQAVQRIMAARA